MVMKKMEKGEDVESERKRMEEKSYIAIDVS